jgi:DNA topoisomerase-1
MAGTKNLVIVESPAKAKTIEGFLGKDFTVRSSFGHVRDLVKKGLGVDIKKKFAPNYEVSPDKEKVIEDLKKLSQKADMVWLATDEDREGEAISWHLAEALKLEDKKTKRIVFSEITKPAILKAISNPRRIDKNLVDAQQARRILDRLVGFELSPILWKKVRPSLSAGRVQSVTVRLIVEREREISDFKTENFFRVVAVFKTGSQQFKAELNRRFKTKKEAEAFLQSCINFSFTVGELEMKPGKRSPSAPFTTSTLQQEASRKLGFSVAQTMTLAQRLYEAGKITYMRTDSVNLSDTALEQIEKAIQKNYGKKYHNKRQFKTKSKGAQEAHEAIRPTYIENPSVDGERNEQRLYELIWKRTIASQMSDAELEKTIVTIPSSNKKEFFTATGEVIKFDGFLKVYLEGSDDESEEESEGMLPALKIGQSLQYSEITATERFTHHPPRYTEASLVKKLEELGIGRPSTYAPTISTILKRNYVEKTERMGKPRSYFVLSLNSKKISTETKTENTGAEKNKLFPTDIGMVVNDFLLQYFPKILDFHFTAHVEEEFDEIAEGKMNWSKMLEEFYKPFHKTVEKTIDTSERATGERILGKDPKTKKPVSVRIGRFGPMVQLGASDDEVKPRYAGLRKDQRMETITLEQALELFLLPRLVGEFESKEVKVNIGRFGPYILHNNIFVSLKKEDDPYTVELNRCIELIQLKRKADAEKLIKEFSEDKEIKILNGRWGPYISKGKLNFKIPKGADPKKLKYNEVCEIINASENGKSNLGGKKEAVVKKISKALSVKKSNTKSTKVKKAASKKAAPKKQARKRK